MEIKTEHRELLKSMGLKEEDFNLFDGEFVRYGHDKEKGVRLYDPYYRTSCNEYIDADGWSSWSNEKDTFMSNILKDAKKKRRKRKRQVPGPPRCRLPDPSKRDLGGTALLALENDPSFVKGFAEVK